MSPVGSCYEAMTSEEATVDTSVCVCARARVHVYVVVNCKV
jgi:hypothetical protein